MVRDYERLARAVPAAIHLSSGRPDARKPGEPRRRGSRGRDGERPAENRSLPTCRRAIREAFAGTGGGPSWNSALIEEANSLCRELVERTSRSPVGFSGASWHVPGSSEDPGVAFFHARSCAEDRGQARRGARDPGPRPRGCSGSAIAIPEIELGFWHYVRAAVLYNLRRLDEALHEIRASGKSTRCSRTETGSLRCGQTEAIFLSDLGRLDEALALYRRLVDDPPAGESPAARAVSSDQLRRRSRAAPAAFPRRGAVYARAIDLLTKTGQTHLLMRVREGLSNIAVRENRLEEALAMKISLRPRLQASLRSCPRTSSTKLGIAEVYTRQAFRAILRTPPRSAATFSRASTARARTGKRPRRSPTWSKRERVISTSNAPRARAAVPPATRGRRRPAQWSAA